MRTSIRVETRQYELSHGRKPRQSCEYATSSWAFLIDGGKEPVWVTASYAEALRHAKTLAQYSVTVLP